jgi:molybdenum cofactor cytidylyltransferase
VPGPVCADVVILAAGLSRRFGGDKLTALWRGEPVLSHTLSAVAAARQRGLLATGVVVHRSEDAAAARAAAAAGFTACPNPGVRPGLSESLRLGLAALDPSGVDWALIVLGDQPMLRPDVIAALLEGADPSSDLVRPVYAEAPDVPGHPVLVHRRLWPEAAALRDDQGFGALAPRKVTFVPVSGANPDIDTVRDLASLAARFPLTVPSFPPPHA